MQIVKPDMYPLNAVFLMLFLFIIGVLGLLLLYLGLKSLKNKWRFPTILKIVLGTLCLGFVIYNWFGYHSIFSENEKLIVGEYYANNSKLTINKDNTWKITGDNESICKNGNWEFVMSEDWCYWNIESENMKRTIQIGISRNGAPPTIEFKEQQLIFERKK